MLKHCIALLLFSSLHAKPLEEGSILHLEINMHAGHKLVLNDESVWEVDPADVGVSGLWLSPFPVKVTFQGEGPYPYSITNMQSEKTVKAKRS